MGQEAFLRENGQHVAVMVTDTAEECGWRRELATIRAHELQVAEDLRGAVHHAIDQHGATWAEVGRLIGLTRQGARQRYAGRRGS